MAARHWPLRGDVCARWHLVPMRRQLRARLVDFVAEFNSANGLIADQFIFDEATETAGALSGDSTILGVQSRLRSAIIGSIVGVK